MLCRPQRACLIVLNFTNLFSFSNEMSHSGDSRDHYYSAMAQRFEQKKCQLKCQFNTMVDDMFDFFLNEMTVVAANRTAPEAYYPMASPTGWTMSSGDGGNGGSISRYFPGKVELTENDTTEMPAAATAFGCLLPEGSSSSLKTEAKDANYMMNQINYQTMFQSEPSTSSASAVMAAAIGNFNNNTRGYDDDKTSTSNYDGNEDDDNVIVYSVKCQTCEDIFEDTNQLDVHTLAVHKYRPRRCLVIGCSASYDDGRSLEEHVRVKHSNNTEFNCKRCRLVFHNHTQLEAHFVSAHHMGRFGCGIGGCKYIANNRFDIQYHVSTRHNKTAAAQPTTLKRNTTGTRINTTKINPNRGNNKRKREPTSIMCDFPGCTTVLSSPYNYRRHQRVHTGVRPFICAYPTCEGASFKEKNHCIAHIREVHLNLPRYKCDMDENELEAAQDGSEYLMVQHEFLD